MINPNYKHQCIYALDANGNISIKWVGLKDNPSYSTLKDERVPEDFGNYHPDDERYEDPRVEHLYEIFGNDIDIGYNGYIKKRVVSGFRNNGELIKQWQEIYRPVYPYRERELKKRMNFPSEKKLKELGQWKDIEWTVLGPNPNYNK